jgi:hypothetical protein
MLDGSELSAIAALIKASSEPYDSTDSAHIAVDTLDAKFGFFENYLAVMDKTITTNLDVTNILATNTIQTLNSDTLFIQPSGQGAINFLAGLVTMDSNGLVTINGDLIVTGEFLANKVTAPSAGFGDLVTQKLEANEANIKKLTTESLIIASDASASAQVATTSASITTNATAGKATLPKGLTEITINTPNVDASTLAYVTPIGNPQNQVLFVKSKHTCPIVSQGSEPCNPWFTIAINSPLTHDLEFNWWIIKMEGKYEI